MSLVWCNGFDDQDSSRQADNNGWAFTSDTPYGTGYAVYQLSGVTGTPRCIYEIPTVPNTTTLHFSFHMRCGNVNGSRNNGSGDGSSLTIRSGTTIRYAYVQNTVADYLYIDGTLRASSGAANGTSWQHYEFFCTPSGAGTANTKVYKNGALLFDVGFSSNNSVDTVRLSGSAQSDAPLNRTDNFVVWKGDGSGLSGKADAELIVDTKVPESDGTHTSHTPSTGSTGYLTLDESPPSATDYIYSGTTDAKSTFGFGTISTGFRLYGVQQNTYWGKYDVGTLFARMMEIQAGTTSFETTRTLPIDSMDTYSWVRPLAGASTWTSTRLNAAEWGVQVRGTTS
jgi:hypothetical protein